MPVRSFRGSEHSNAFWYLVPQYDELTLFLMSSAFVYLFFVSTELRRVCLAMMPTLDFTQLTLLKAAGFILMVGVFTLFAGGFIMSLIHVFTDREKTDRQKWLMLYFAVVVTHATGLAAGWHIFREGLSWVIVFPLWNIITGFILLMMAMFNLVNETHMPDDDAEPVEVYLSVVIMGGLLWLCHHRLCLHWSITYSICVSYATMVVGMIMATAEKANVLSSTK